MRQKKLMILGGSAYIIPVIKKAHELGIHVITVDYLPDNIGHRYSDEYHNVSIIDKDAVLKLAQKLNIDGISSFVNDVGVVTAAYVAEKLNLNFQCPYESAVILQDKGKFRKFLEDNGFNVPRSRRFDNRNINADDLECLDWPVIVKPTDSCGSRGVTKVTEFRKLEQAIDDAIQNSRDKSYIIEEYISFKGFHSSADSFTVDGELVFNVFSDQLFDKRSLNPYAPTQIIWPSTMEADYQSELDRELQRLMRLLKMKHGIYNIETCVGENNKPYIMEVSPRGGGLRIAEIQKCVYGIDLIEADVKQAVGMPLNVLKPSEPDGVWCEMVIYSTLKKPAVFLDYDIDADVMEKYVKLLDFQKKRGETIEPFAGGNTSFGNIFLHCESREKLDKLLASYSQWFRLITE